MPSVTDHPAEKLAVMVAARMLQHIYDNVELMVAHGGVPDTPRQQKITEARMQSVIKELRAGTVRPWFTRYLEDDDFMERFDDPDLRHEDISKAKNLEEIKDYITKAAKIRGIE